MFEQLIPQCGEHGLKLLPLLCFCIGAGHRIVSVAFVGGGLYEGTIEMLIEGMESGATASVSAPLIIDKYCITSFDFQTTVQSIRS